MDHLSAALDAANLNVIKIDLGKQRPISSSAGTMNAEKFNKIFIERLGPKIAKFPSIIAALHDTQEMMGLLTNYADENNILIKDRKNIEIEIPKNMENLTLNFNLSSKNKDDKFFLTHPDETISKVSGEAYLMIHQIPPLEAVAIARKVIPEYLPRSATGVSEIKSRGKVDVIYNVYTPPDWDKVPTKKMPDSLPPLFEKLVRHLFPLKEEREYFYKWLYHSLFKRSYVFLVLCGAPGTGKNRLKLVLRALHGHLNTVDGKKSTLVERFNSQLSEATLAWFDELKYDMEMENVMKELQNDSIAIERKGVDATRGTKIYSSIVISNNQPRDNYIAFDARKFVPLVIRPKRLEESMFPADIDMLTQKVEDESSKTFDPMFLAQIVKWVKKNGDSKKWPNLEYRGPMFWTLAHTSMTRWQKRAVSAILDPDAKSTKWGYMPSKQSFLWSDFHGRIVKKAADKSIQFPDYTSVRAFFEIFRDGNGKKSFETTVVPGQNILGDFWVKPILKNLEIITEGSVIQKRGEVHGEIKKETDDL